MRDPISCHKWEKAFVLFRPLTLTVGGISLLRLYLIREYEKLDETVPVNAETHSSGNDVPIGEKVSSSEARSDGFVCSVWDCNYCVSALVLMVYCRMVGRCISLKTRRMGHWLKLKTSLHGSWEKERECKNLAVGKNAAFCPSASWVRECCEQYRLGSKHFVFMLTKKVEYLHTQTF